MLYSHQQKILNLNPERHLLAWGTGTGKTKMPFELAEKRNVASLLIVCPKGLKTNWLREKQKYRFEGRLHSMTVKIMTKEEFRRDWKSLEGFQALAIDEAHTFAGMQSQMHKAMVKYLTRHKIQYRWLLTATPFLRNAWNIYALGRLLGAKWNYYTFRQTFFYERYLNAQKTFWEPLPGKQDEIAALVSTIGSTVKLEDCIDYPEMTVTTEYFKLTSGQEKAIKAVKELLPVTRFGKMHQIAGGTLKANEYEPMQTFDTEKTARIVELVEENEKLIISCRYLAEMNMLETLLGSEHMWRIDGETKDKQAVLDEFNASITGVLIVNAACSEGWQAPSASLLVFYSLDFSYKNYVQMMGRIRRIDRPQKCTYITLVCEKSIDEAVLAAVDRKQDFDEAIYDYQVKN